MKKKVKKTKQKVADDERVVKPNDPQADPDEKAFNFGGLPERDLKKNLGCG